MHRIELFLGGIFFSFVLIAAMLAAPIAAHGATITWITSGGGNWNSTANWDPANVPDASGESALIPSSLATPFTIVLNTSPSLDAVNIQSTAATLNLNGSTLTLLTDAGLTNYGIVQGNAGLSVVIGKTTNQGSVNVLVGQTLKFQGDVVNNGLITVNLTQGDTDTHLSFKGTPTLSGTGTVFLNDNGNVARATIDSDSGTLTQAAGHTINGHGRINASLINNGVVNASTSGTLQLSSNAKTNNNIMKSTGGGWLDIRTSVDNTNGTLLADGGNISINSGATITGGTLTSSGSSYFLANGANLSGVTLSTDSQYKIQSNTTTTVTGGMTNNGTITVNSDYADYDTHLAFNGNQTLSGTGTVSLNNYGSTLGRADLNSSGGTLTQAAGHTINGHGRINASLINNGVVNASTNGTLQLSLNAKTNNNIMKSTGGGWLDITVGVTNTGGTLLADGGNISINSGATITGGTLTSSGSSYFQANGANLSGVILSTDSQYKIQSNTTTTVMGGMTNNGTITVNSDYADYDTHLTFSGNQTLSGTGTVSLNNYGSTLGRADLNSSGGTLTQAAGHTINGHGRINASLINNGMVNASTSGTLQLSLNAKANNNLMESTGGGWLDITIGVTNTGGTLLADGGNISINGGATITGGTLTSSGSSYFLANGGCIFNALTLTAGTQCKIQQGVTTNVTGGLTNNGTITVNLGGTSDYTHLVFGGSQTLSGTGTVSLNDNGTSSRATVDVSNGATLTQAAGHTINGHGRIAGPGSINNLGTIEAKGGTLQVTATISQVSGATLTGGTWIARAGSTLDLSSAGNLYTNQGTVILDGSGSTFAKINGLTTNDIQGMFDVLGGRIFTTAGNLANSGSLLVGGGGTFTVSGNLSGAGNTTVTDSSLLYAKSIVQNTLTIGPGATVTINPISGGPTASSPVISPVPEPGTWLLIFMAIFAWAGYKKIAMFHHK